MIDFEIKSKTQPIGTRKGQTVYFAQPKSQQYFTNKMLIEWRHWLLGELLGMDFIHWQRRSVYYQRWQLGFQTWRLPQRKIRWREERCAGLCQCRFQGSKSERPLKYRVYSHIVRLEKRMVFLFSSLLPVRVATISKAMQTAIISKTILAGTFWNQGLYAKHMKEKNAVFFFSSALFVYICIR